MRRIPEKKVDYEESYWGQISDPDGIIRNRLTERDKQVENIKQEIAFINQQQPGKIVDIGCGLGFLLSAIDSQWKKHGVEISKFASQYAENWGEIFHGTVEEANYQNGYFDVVVIHHVIEHIEKPEVMIQEIYRILREGGHLIIATPDFDSGCARRFGKNYRLLHDDTHISLFSYESMLRFLRDFGFLIDHVEFPFFETPYFTAENLMRLFDTTKISPPFYGNFMTFYCHK